MKEKMVDEVMQIMPVQKQTTAGQRTRFQAFVAVGDNDGHLVAPGHYPIVISLTAGTGKVSAIDIARIAY